MRRAILLTVGILLAMVCTSVVSFGVGFVLGERKAQHRQFLEESELMAPVLSSDPAFANLTIHENASGGVFFAGGVRTDEDLERLRREVTRALGGARAKFVTHGLHVENRPFIAPGKK